MDEAPPLAQLEARRLDRLPVAEFEQRRRTGAAAVRPATREVTSDQVEHPLQVRLTDAEAFQMRQCIDEVIEIGARDATGAADQLRLLPNVEPARVARVPALD